MQADRNQGPGRIAVIDGLRGLFLVLMTTTHLELAGGVFIKHLHPDTVSFIDSAYGFVFLSGLVVGLVYARTMMKRGAAEGAARLRRRTGEVYLHALAVVAALAGAAVVVPGFAASAGAWLGPLAVPDWRVIAAGVLLLQEADYADILQPYVFYMLAAPFALRACLAGRWRWVMGLSVAGWLAAQFGAAVPVTTALREAMQAVRPDLRLPSEFNILAWQLIFFTGLVLGARSAMGELRLERWADPSRPALLLASLAVLGVSAVTTVTIYHGPEALGAAIDAALAISSSKPRAGWLCLLNFAAAAYAVFWSVTIGGKAARPWVRTLCQALNRVLAAPFLRLLGRHSLQVYVWHVALVYALRLADARIGPFDALGRNLLSLAVLAALAAPALWRERADRGPIQIVTQSRHKHSRPSQAQP